jgi:hypothetical protein
MITCASARLFGRFPAHHQSQPHFHGVNGVPDAENNESDPGEASQWFNFSSQSLNPACPMRIWKSSSHGSPQEDGRRKGNKQRQDFGGI